MLDAVPNTLGTEYEEYYVCARIEELGQIWGGIVVLGDTQLIES